MALEQGVKQPPPPLTEEEMADGFARLAARLWRVKEAQPFARKIKAAPAIAAPFLVERLADGCDRDREIATALQGQLQGLACFGCSPHLVQGQSQPVVMHCPGWIEVCCQAEMIQC